MQLASSTTSKRRNHEQLHSTANDLFAAMKTTAPNEPMRFFTLLGENVFENEDFSRDEVFGDVVGANFTVSEVAEYLEVSVPTFRRYVKAQTITPNNIVDINQFLQRKT